MLSKTGAAACPDQAPAARNILKTCSRNLRRSATEAQLGLEFGGVSEMEFEFELLFQPGLKFTFKLEFEFEFDSEFKSELAFEVAHSSWSSN